MVLIFLIILIIGFAGTALIVLKKIPVLASLPQSNSSQKTIKDILFNFAKIIKNKTPLEKFSGELFLQKVLSRTRVLVLKIDNKTFHWITSLREKAQKNKFGENDSYWKGIKSSIAKPVDDQSDLSAKGEKTKEESQKIFKERRSRKKRLPV